MRIPNNYPSGTAHGHRCRRKVADPNSSFIVRSATECVSMRNLGANIMEPAAARGGRLLLLVSN